MATYGYVRVSSVGQVDGTSLDEQVRRVQGIALLRGIADFEIFRDEGISGSVALDQRPMGSQLMLALRPGDTVIASKLDRMFRNAADALTRAQGWKEQGVKLILADMGPDPVTENGVGKLMFTMLAAMAEWERDRIAERVAEGRKAKLARGGALGTAPLGYTKVGRGKDAMLVPIPGKDQLFQTIADAREAGMSYRAIVEVVKLKHGVPCSYESIRNHVLRTQP